jgi:hypothetical protein
MGPFLSLLLRAKLAALIVLPVTLAIMASKQSVVLVHIRKQKLLHVQLVQVDFIVFKGHLLQLLVRMESKLNSFINLW